MNSNSTLRVLCLGDVVGRPGRDLLNNRLRDFRIDERIDLVIANGENAAGGTSIDPGTARDIFKAGVDIITLGDHTWQKRGIGVFLEDERSRCIRPANYPVGAMGSGSTVWTSPTGIKVMVMNLMGRVFMTGLFDCPFRKAEEILASKPDDCRIVVCDFHAEASSEKIAMGRFLDGRASLVFGTHTHVQTADEQILPAGTAYITDLGMSGSTLGVIGMRADIALKRFLTGLPHSYEVAEGSEKLNGVLCQIDTDTGAGISITRVSIGDLRAENAEHK